MIDPPEDVEAVAEAIDSLLADPERAGPGGRGRPAPVWRSRATTAYDALGEASASGDAPSDVPPPGRRSRRAQLAPRPEADARPDARPAGDRQAADPARERLVLVDAVGTAPFAVTAVAGGDPAPPVDELVGVTVALVLFAVGCAAFLPATPGPSSAAAPTRSPSRPLVPARRPRGARPGQAAAGLLLAVQVVVALATAGSSGRFSPLAFGVLVPVFGVGLNGLWAARHGALPAPPSPPRRPRRSPPRWRDGARMLAMAESATQTVTIAASPEQCFAVAIGLPPLPGVGQGREGGRPFGRPMPRGGPRAVEFRASALGRSTHYTLAYDYSAAPEKVSWQLVHGDIMRAIDGAYTFTPSATDPGSTDVVYELSIELVVPLPGFVKRRAEVRILNTVKELKARAEA